MNAATPAAGPIRSAGLAERLVAAVRAEFRADLLTFPASDPVFGGGACKVAGCSRSARGQGLCPGHHQRWNDAGRPEVAAFAASTDPRWQRQQPNSRCRVEGCGYGVARGGMCQLHVQRWDRAGRPALDLWLTDAPPVRGPEAGARCRVEHCGLWPQAAAAFCHAHAATWRARGRPDADVFAASFGPAAHLADETVRLGGLDVQLRLEVQYALQCRRDERASKIQPAVVMAVVRLLAGTSVSSLLARTEQGWRDQLAAHRTASAFVVYARRKVEDLADAGGWEAEFPRAVWQLRRLGYPGNQTLDFTALAQPWLREPAKRWLRWRLSLGLNLETVRRGLRSLTRIGVFCAQGGVDRLADIDRGVLERYLADLHAELAGAQRHNDCIGQLSSFLHAVRQHRWAEGLPGSALLFPDDYPKRGERLPARWPSR